MNSGDSLAFLSGGGEMGTRIRALEWSATPLGPADAWPQSLRSALSICLNSSFPIALYWGSELRLLYNDDWSAIPGEKHPWVLGRPAREAWPEIWDIISPLFESVMANGEATRRKDQLLPMHRRGFTEECYFDYTFSPIRGESGAVDGVFNAVIETTSRVIGERRLRSLRELAVWKSGEWMSVRDACRAASQTLATNLHDLPFTLLYLLDASGKKADLAGLSGLDRESPAALASVNLDEETCPWPFRQVVASGELVEVDDLIGRFGTLPCGVWPESPEQAVVLPLAKPGQKQLAGFVVAGISPRLVWNDEYRGFLDLLAGHIAAAIFNAKAYEEERQRAQALTELDRAKTAFFSNVSHEFRTPLTLMLGPVEDLLTRSYTDLTPAAAGQLEIVNRNGLRLLRLVNTLLDFSRIEAGRVRAVYQPTDLAVFSADLASNFRSACERAGLHLNVDCAPLDEPVFVDREMWEKIVLNLLSNAFKFTFAGEIEVTLRRKGNAAELRVRDTGTGVPASEIPRLFERFHRVKNAKGRTHEGSGIGLALVQELVKLHGGSIAAETKVGEGTTFVVTVPLGSTHLPIDQIGDGRSAFYAGTGASPFVEEALRWLPEEEQIARRQELPTYQEPLPTPYRRTDSEVADDRPRVLVADDNADMRHYVARLLSEHFRVEAVPDGEAALESVRVQLPDLVLTDVMMPRLDGFGLLRELRADPRTVHIPVLMLSARAGEESRVEGVQAGADDYLVKPFSARELLARVSAHLQLAQLRRESEAAVRESELRYRLVGEAANDAIWDWNLVTNHVTWNEGLQTCFGYTADQVGDNAMWWIEGIHPDDRERISHHLHAVIDGTGELWNEEYRFRRADGSYAEVFDRGRIVRYEGRPVRMVGSMLDLTERKQAEAALRESEERFRGIFTQTLAGIAETDLTGQFVDANQRYCEIVGRSISELRGLRMQDITYPDDLAHNLALFAEAITHGIPFVIEKRYVRPDGSLVWVSNSVSLVRDERGAPKHVVAASLDITANKQAEAVLRESEAHFRSMADNAPTMIWVTNPAADCTYISQQWCEYTGTTQQQNLGLGWFDCVHPDEQLQTREQFLKASASHTPFSFDYRLRRHDGEYRWAVDSGRPRFDEDEQFLGYVGTVTDIHERREAAEALRKAAAKLSEADRRKNEFLATLAHELRNPLAPIRNGMQLIRLAKGDWDIVEQARALIDRQLDQMVRLVDDLMDVSRISTGKVHLRKERVKLASVVQSAIESSRPHIEQMGHELKVTLPGHPVWMEVDPTRLAQVLLNLLNNAAKYSDRNGHIWLSAAQDGRDVIIAVRDAGIGIPADQLPRIFEMFSQVSPSLDKAQGGLGIGLSLVKRLVELHSGTIEARSGGPGQGSEFVVRIPAVVDSSTSSEEISRPVELRSKLRILIVDDNRDSADSLALMLKINGNETFTAYDGEEAVTAAAKLQPDVVLLDIGMPKLNGYEACRRIRAMEQGKEMFLIAQTGWSQDVDRQRTEAAGFDYHLVKPVDPQALMKLLRSLSKP